MLICRHCQEFILYNVMFFGIVQLKVFLSQSETWSWPLHITLEIGLGTLRHELPSHFWSNFPAGEKQFYIPFYAVSFCELHAMNVCQVEAAQPSQRSARMGHLSGEAISSSFLPLHIQPRHEPRAQGTLVNPLHHCSTCCFLIFFPDRPICLPWAPMSNPIPGYTPEKQLGAWQSAQDQADPGFWAEYIVTHCRGKTMQPWAYCGEDPELNWREV